MDIDQKRRGYRKTNDYFSAVFTDVKVVLRVVPSAVTTVMIAIEMPAAIKPYSIAVAPESSFKKRRIVVIASPFLAQRYPAVLG